MKTRQDVRNSWENKEKLAAQEASHWYKMGKPERAAIAKRMAALFRERSTTQDGCPDKDNI